jgi:asparagine synthase (glutamine-hydrolysing)
MPGITGRIRFRSRAVPEDPVDSMLQEMMHEPFYLSGKYINEQMGLSVGWTCFRGDVSDCQPIWNERRDVVLIFSGEHYGEKQEIEALRSKGHEFDTREASYLVHLYEEMGLDFLGKLNGQFCGVLVDLRKQKAVLFNDRFGLNRIYYHENSDGLFFASEAKALLKVLPGVRRLDGRGLGEFFSCGCVLQNRSLFTGVSLIPAGSRWVFFPGQPVERGTYFSQTSWEDQAVLSEGEYYEKLKETFNRILPRYLNGGRPIGVSLTGGVDSRLVMAWARRAPHTLPCYTFGGKYRDCVDVTIAREVARICQQPHRVIQVGRDFLGEFSALAEKTVYLSDGAMDVSGSADLFVNRVARQIAPVRLTGNYGGEILRGIVAFKPVVLHQELFAREFAAHLDAAAQTYAKEIQERRLSFVAFKQVPWHHYSRLCLERSQITMRSPYLDNDLVGLVFRAPPNLASSNELSLRLIADGNAALGRFGTDRGVRPRPIPIVTEARHLYQEFTFKAEYAYDYGMPQWLARIDSLLAPLHPERLFLGRHKFHHFRIWYRDELSNYLKAVLLDYRTLNRPYLRGARLEEMVKNHIEGTRNHTLEFHRLLTSELVQRQLIEQN